MDVLVTGHSHKLDIWQGHDGGLYVNPGSVRCFVELIVLLHMTSGMPVIHVTDCSNDLFTKILSLRQATGAYTTTSAMVHPPSFILMDVQGSKVVTYSYILDGEVCYCKKLRIFDFIN